MNNTENTQQNIDTVNKNKQPVNQSVQGSPTPQQGKPTLAEPLGNQVEEGVNLIPSLTKEEKVHVKKKNTLNIGSLLSIIVLSTIALGIVGFNITSKMQLNSSKSNLSRIEKSVNTQIDKIESNNIILTRIDLYQTVKKNSFSHKEIIEFLNEVSGKVSGISYRSISISEDLTFELSGNSPDLEQISRLWYLFGINESIENINLESVAKNENGATFSFEGKLKFDSFKSQ
ncbi:MAG TPA: hypothetical protein PKH06_01130 [Candidatus Dojkabacteria bacterium]|nr:hypothetical protein [Candidatus Dojkabacteria bacterium]